MSVPITAILNQQSSPAPSSNSSAHQKHSLSKRRKITTVACVNCRRRKTKCDGKHPTCLQCQARSDSQCHYDMSVEQRRVAGLREEVKHLAMEKDTLETLIRNLQVATEDESMEIWRQIRSGINPYTLAQQVQAGRSLTPAKIANTLDTLHKYQTSTSPVEFSQYVVSTPCHSKSNGSVSDVGTLLQPLNE